MILFSFGEVGKPKSAMYLNSNSRIGWKHKRVVSEGFSALTKKQCYWKYYIAIEEVMKNLSWKTTNSVSQSYQSITFTNKNSEKVEIMYCLMSLNK